MNYLPIKSINDMQGFLLLLNVCCIQYYPIIGGSKPGGYLRPYTNVSVLSLSAIDRSIDWLVDIQFSRSHCDIILPMCHFHVFDILYLIYVFRFSWAT